MPDNASFLFMLGTLLLTGLAADYVGRQTFLPRVTILMLFGLALGQYGLDLLPGSITRQFETITVLALVMVGFLLGGKLTGAMFRSVGKQLVWISLAAALGTTLVVGAVLMLVGWPHEIAIVLGCIAAATAPAATVDTVRETGTDSPFAQLLLGIVAIDDAWALILMTLGLALIAFLDGSQAIAASGLYALHEIGGGVGLGLALGLPAAFLTGRIQTGRPMLLEALGLVFICGGLAIWLGVSFIIASMTMGTVIANKAVHHDYPFHAIENIEWPFLVVFFVLAGASLDIHLALQLGLLGLVYLLARVAGKLLGSWVGATASDAPPVVRRWIGVALLPQAGVAIGMALLAADRVPAHGQTILAAVAGTTVVFELFGPIATRLALQRTMQQRG